MLFITKIVDKGCTNSGWNREIDPNFRDKGLDFVVGSVSTDQIAGVSARTNWKIGK